MESTVVITGEAGAHPAVDAGPAAEAESGCRICQLGDLGEGEAGGGGARLVRLGCGCKGALAAAHRQCAEAWFWVRGDRRCEICGENAENVGGKGGGQEFMQQWHQTATAAMSGSPPQRQCCCCSSWRSHPFCNLLLACFIVVFILTWFLHHHTI